MISDVQEAQQTVTAKKGSPWSCLGRGLTDEEWAALKNWRKGNPLLQFKTGETRKDGRIFLKYNQANRGGEKWVTEGTKEKLKAASKTVEKLQYQRNWRKKRYSTDPVYRDKACKLSKEWYNGNKKQANSAKRIWWKKKYDSDPVFRRKVLDKSISRRKKLGHYCVRDALRRVDSICGNAALIRRIYRHAALIKRSSSVKLEVDHIIPVCHGGKHHELNLQLLEEQINRSKNNNPFWMSHDGLSLDWRDVPRSLWPEKLRPEYERLIALHPKPVHATRTRFNGKPFHPIA